MAHRRALHRGTVTVCALTFDFTKMVDLLFEYDAQHLFHVTTLAAPRDPS